eukprot:GHVH01001067.1.p1 GENE.GHVH01001067.1~~GHVH01001067.1.p1  ORF type:complete len:823 (+),score=97.77 GHVH01001067.1:238-2706(+)
MRQSVEAPPEIPKNAPILKEINFDAIMGILEINEDGAENSASSGTPNTNASDIDPVPSEFLVIITESALVADLPSDYPACLPPEEYSGLHSTRSDNLWMNRRDSKVYNLTNVKLVPFQTHTNCWDDNDDLLQQAIGSNTMKLKKGIELFFSKHHYYSYDVMLTQTLQNQYMNGGFRPHGFPPLSQYYPMFNEWILGANPIEDDLCVLRKMTYNNPLMNSAAKSFVWNCGMSGAFEQAGVDMCWLVPVIQGYVGYTSVTVQRDGNSIFPMMDSQEGPKPPIHHTIDIYVIGRREWHRSGTRYHCRGIDTDGNVSNFVESEMIVHVGYSDPSSKSVIRLGVHRLPPSERRRIVKNYGPEFSNDHVGHGWASFVQIRGSVPLFWEQNIMGKNPVQPPPVINHPADFQGQLTYPNYVKHFNKLKRIYGDRIWCFNLLSSSRGNEHLLTEEWRKLGMQMENDTRNRMRHQKGRVASSALLSSENEADYVPPGCPVIKEIDFHKNQKSKGFIASLEHNYLLEGMSTALMATASFQERPIAFPDSLHQLQMGVARTNCLDCLDRTNAFQYWFGWMFLRSFLISRGFILLCSEPNSDIYYPPDMPTGQLEQYCKRISKSTGSLSAPRRCCAAFRMIGRGALDNEEPMERLISLTGSSRLSAQDRLFGQSMAFNHGAQDMLGGWPGTQAKSQDSNSTEPQNLFQFITSNMWGEHGDRISQIYTGTGSVITPLMVTGKTSMNQKMNHFSRSVNRFYQNLVEDQNRNEVIRCIIEDWKKHDRHAHHIIDETDKLDTKKFIQKTLSGKAFMMDDELQAKSGDNELNDLLEDLEA